MNDWKNATTWLGEAKLERTEGDQVDTVEQYPGVDYWSVTVRVGDGISINRHFLHSVNDAKAEADRIRAHWIRL